MQDLKPFILNFRHVADQKVHKQWVAAVEFSHACQKVIDLIQENNQEDVLNALIDCEASSMKCIRSCRRRLNLREEQLYDTLIGQASNCSKVLRIYISNYLR